MYKQATVAFNKNILMKTNTQAQNRYGVPIAIVVAGLLIAGAVFWTGSSGSVASNTAEDIKGGQPSSHPAQAGGFRMPDETDHVRGNPDAKIVVVEFSDFECPFCGRLHPTLTRVVEENDDVAWVYRHFPLNSHTNAFSAAVASECIDQAGGNDVFWDFADTAFANQRQLGDRFYRGFVQEAGIDAGVFEICLNNKAVAEGVQQDLDEVIAVGGRGTPYVVVVTPTGKLMPFSGALSFEQVMNVIEQARNN